MEISNNENQAAMASLETEKNQSKEWRMNSTLKNGKMATIKDIPHRQFLFPALLNKNDSI